MTARSERTPADDAAQDDRPPRRERRAKGKKHQQSDHADHRDHGPTPKSSGAKTSGHNYAARRSG